MLYALAHPLSLLVLLSSFVLAVTLHGWVQALVSTRLGDRVSKSQGRCSPDPRRHLDPFGAVGAALSGLGWGKPLDAGVRRTRGAVVAVSLAGPAVNVLLGVALLLGFRAAYGPFPLTEFANLLQEGTPAGVGDLGQLVLLFGGASQLYLGVLNLVPLPPLDGGRMLFAFSPRSPGWQKAEHYLVEQNIGLIVLLVLLLIPVGGPVPPLPALLDIVLSPVLSLLLGG